MSALVVQPINTKGIPCCSVVAWRSHRSLLNGPKQSVQLREVFVFVQVAVCTTVPRTTVWTALQFCGRLWCSLFITRHQQCYTSLTSYISSLIAGKLSHRHFDCAPRSLHQVQLPDIHIQSGKLKSSRLAAGNLLVMYLQTGSCWFVVILS
ncbi:hypothetical protein VTK73DRAFT_5926 [Phialemonium thermophilum]|uniref:Uncharacterized protein n=1 Tax=Phialemonium thermophilum TaxID=223376 RepID=A0ABR3WLK1_9PEZI